MSSRPIRTVRILSGRQRRAKKRTLLTAQSGRCAGCGREYPPELLILKHKIHRNRGGTSRLANLHLVCQRCGRTGGPG